MRKEPIERRVEELERELATLRKKVDALSGDSPWWERIAGSFHGDAAYKQAMRLGREYRRAQRPNGSR
jgi:hypothetical protein